MSSTLHEIPKPLTKLIRLILRGFYNIEHKLVIDMLVRRRETKEDDLVEVLKLERKHLRSLIQQMRQDKFVNVRLIMETDEDGKSTRRNYYSINYRMFVNVVKYKIDHVRRKLETEERDLTSRASFICNSCNKTYTDLEVGQIYVPCDDPNEHHFRCSYCGGVVDEDPNIRPQADSRLIMAKFNEQMKPIYELLKETEGINLSINEADRNNITNNGVGGPTSGSTMVPGSTNGSFNIDHNQLPNGSTQGLDTNAQDQYPVHIKGLEQDKAKPTNIKIPPEIEALLLREENSMTSHEEEATNDTSNIEMDVKPLMIRVGQTMVPVDKISDEHVEFMTQQQRDEYRRIMQLIYNLVYG